MGYRVLIVDDGADQRNIHATVLSKKGHFCDTAVDGADALEKADKKDYDAIISDVKMPKMNGIDLAR